MILLPLTTPTVPIKAALADAYLDYLNNYLTADKFAADYNLDPRDAATIRYLGRKFHAERTLK